MRHAWDFLFLGLCLNLEPGLSPKLFRARSRLRGNLTLRGLEFGNIVSGMFTPVLAHSKSLSLIECIAVGADRMQRNFEPMREQVEAWQRSELTNVTAKVVIYEAFVGQTGVF